MIKERKSVRKYKNENVDSVANIVGCLCSDYSKDMIATIVSMDGGIGS